jgi:hypothetical protein
MKNLLLAAVAAFALAACGQSTAPTEEAPAEPQSLMEQVEWMQPEAQLVFAFQQLAAYQAAHPEVEPRCASVRATEARGVIPEDVAPDSIYAAHVGSAVYSVQCGNLVSRERFDPTEHWLVVFAPGASEVSLVNCADARGGDNCPRAVPRTTAAPTTP